MSPVHVREKPPLRHMIDVQAPSGRHYRLGEDEPDPANVFSGLRYGDTMPGGYETADCTLPREPGVEYPDLERLSKWRVLGVGGEPYWGGRLERAPRTSGDEVSVSPSAVGYQAALDDDKSARAIYRDIDLSRWQPMSNTRRATVIASNAIYDSQVTNDQAGPQLMLEVDGQWLSTFPPLAEAWYDAGPGELVDYVTHFWTRNSLATSTNWFWRFAGADTDVSTAESGSDLQNEPSATGSGQYTPASDRRFIAVQFFFNAASANTQPGVKISVSFKLAVYGDHGLTVRGTEPDAGFYASDVVRHAVQMFAPQLNIKADSIQQSSFVVPHLVFLEPTTASEIVRQASRFNLPDWAVWDDQEFVWHQAGARGRTWRLRIGPSQLEETGPQADRVWESVIVSYQDVDGSTRTVGPPGSGADTESADLKDSDPDNPANKVGIVRRDILTMGVSTAAGATEVGRQFLEQATLLDRSGKARVVGWAEDDRGVLHPFAAIRSGDYAVFVDAADPSPRKIVRTDKDYDTRTCTLDLDAPPEGLQQLLERLGVVLVPLGL